MSLLQEKPISSRSHSQKALLEKSLLINTHDIRKDLNNSPLPG